MKQALNKWDDRFSTNKVLIKSNSRFSINRIGVYLIKRYAENESNNCWR